MFRVITVSTALTLFSFGCASQRIVSQPSKITLEEAMASVGHGFKALKDAEGGMQLGLIPSEVDVTFNIAASGEDNQKIYLDLNPTSVKTGAEASSKSTASRGNQITIKFQHIFLLPKDTLVTLKTPDQMEALVELVKKFGIVMAR